MLNALQKNVSKTILTTLEERNAELGQAIRQKMLTFADLSRLEAASLQKIMREVDMRDLALSLKKADDVLKNALLGGISKRAAETVNEEMAFMGSVKLKEIDAAQLRIIEILNVGSKMTARSTLNRCTNLPPLLLREKPCPQLSISGEPSRGPTAQWTGNKPLPRAK